MKKYLFGFFSLCIILSLLPGACGGFANSDHNNEQEEKEESIEKLTLTPQTTKISGPLGMAYTTVDRNYKIKGDSRKFNVEIELTDSSQLPQNFSSASVGTDKNKGDSNYAMLANFMVEFLDEEGNIIETEEAGDRIGHLFRLSQGDKGTISFYLPCNLEDISQFRITSDYYPNEFNEGKVDSNDEDFDKAMEHATKAVETTTKMMKGILNLSK